MMKRNVALVVCALWAVACSSGSVKGSVQLEGAADSSGIAITLNGGSKPVTLVTEANGAFAFDPVSDGMYSLVMESSDMAEGRWVMAVQVKDGKPVDVPAVKLTLVGTVRGKVEVEGGLDSSGVQVAVAGTDRLALTGPDGSFMLRGVPAGAQKLVAVREGFQAAILDLTVSRGEQQSPVIALKRGNMAAVVEGNVGYYTGANPTNITVKAKGTTFSATPDESGRYTLKLPAGAYTLVAEAPQYPAQVIAHVTVSAGAVTQAPVALLSIYRRLPSTVDSREGATLQLLDDKQHALVVRYTDNGSVASLYDLDSDRERVFFATVDDSVSTGDFVVSTNGRGVALSEDNGYVVFDTQTGASYVLRAQDSAPTAAKRSSLWFGWNAGAFSKDSMFFFFNDGSQVYRLSLANGQVTAFPADYGAEQVDADHYFVYDQGASSTEFTASLVTPSSATAVLPKIGSSSSYGVYGKSLVALTDCDGTNCSLKLVDGLTGTVRTVSGSYSQTTYIDSTEHANWLVLSSSPYYFLSLSQATATALPAGLSPYSLDINPNGTRAVFTTYDSDTAHTRLYVVPMPPTSMPTTATAESTSSFDYGWLSNTRMFAFDNAMPYRAIDMKNDTVTTVTDIMGNQWIRGNMVSWKRADKALMGASGDGAAFVLNTNAKDTAYVDYQQETRNSAWSVWAVYENSDYTLVARENASGAVRTYKSLYPYDPRLRATLGTSGEGSIGSESTLFVRRNYGDGAYELLDLPTGTRRMAIEPSMAGFNNAGFTSDGTFWISAYYYADSSGDVTAPAIAIF
ncbi:carboxypeptidase-like regulatory domain-containing protein [Archangium sp.]|uniref:carboxypeptidase-like regulatory domain-containing protein n=1 Tax=Archangium sp. TaxID=1872627 RepID=UPI00389A0CBF